MPKGQNDVKLAAWRRQNDMTQVELADRIGCTQSYVSQIERSTNPLVPKKEIARAIYEITNGAVTPNDFYDLHSGAQDKRQAA